MTHTDFNHLPTSIKAPTPEQVRRLRRQLAEPKNRPAPASGKAARRAESPSPRKKPLTRDEFNQRLMAAGLITSLPDPSLDIDDDPDDQPVTINGEPLSETIIRERR
jgi:hypothetical protein